MTNRDPASPRGSPRAGTKVDRRSRIAMAVGAGVLVVAAILYFSAASQNPEEDGSTTPNSTEQAPANSAPADNTGTTTQ